MTGQVQPGHARALGSTRGTPLSRQQANVSLPVRGHCKGLTTHRPVVASEQSPTSSVLPGACPLRRVSRTRTAICQGSLSNPLPCRPWWWIWGWRRQAVGELPFDTYTGSWVTGRRGSSFIRLHPQCHGASADGDLTCCSPDTAVPSSACVFCSSSTPPSRPPPSMAT